MAKLKAIICPYCGETQAADGPGPERCRACGGLFEPLSRQATHNAMGPWHVRDERRPFQPGCSYETLVKLIERGQVTKHSIIRGPTTKQFWTIAKRVPGVAHLLGYCHNCDASVDAGDHGCHACGVPFGAYLDRNFLGLPEIRPLPWEAGVEEDQSRRGVLSEVDIRRAAEPLGISSFASDVELRSAGLAPMRSIPAAPVAPGNPGQRHIASDHADPAQEGQAPQWSAPGAGVAQGSELPSARSSMRSLQRRVDDLRRTIRILAFALVIAAIIGIGATFALLSRRAAVEGQSPPLPATPASQPQAVEPPKPSASRPVEASDVSPGADDVEDLDIDESYAQARSLIEQARQTDRPRSDRISDYQEAIRLLKQVAAAEHDSQPAGDAGDELRRIEHELKALQLEEFFP